MDASFPVLDTPRESQRRVDEHWLRMTPRERFDEVAKLNEACIRLAHAGARLRYPTASDEEQRLRVLALQLGRNAMIRVYGWDPDLQGW